MVITAQMKQQIANEEQKQFDAWMNRVDRILIASIGLSSNDMPDCCWRDMFQDDMTPDDAIELSNEEWLY
tara:strand:- start:302 stop:511 length:210 start_codon:yes stop_codon:yes gene_type:complete